MLSPALRPGLIGIGMRLALEEPTTEYHFFTAADDSSKYSRLAETTEKRYVLQNTLIRRISAKNHMN